MININKYLKVAFLAIIIATSLISCEEYLDVNPELGISSEDVFSDYYTTREVVDRANKLIHNYVYATSDWDGEPLCIADEAQTSQSGSPTGSVMNSGNWMNSTAREFGGVYYMSQQDEFNSNNGQQLWNEPVEEAFIAIRAANSVIENIGLLKDYPEELGYSAQELKNQLLGQCYFLRAWHYFQIIRRYGGFPIMSKTFPTDYNFDEVRPTYQTSTDSLVSDLNNAIQLLPEKWNDQNIGRATKAAAKSLKAMTLLYAASPLMNTDNPTPNTGAEAGVYDIEYATRAVQASVEAINGLGASRFSMYSWDEYNESFVSRETGYPKEDIFQPPLNRLSSPSNGYAGQGWFLPEMDGGWANQSQPTQNAVDWFETADGYAITDPEAISSGSYDPQNPYENRDPRLRNAIYVHGDDMYAGGANPTGGLPNDLQADIDGYHYNFEINNKGKLWCGYYIKGKLRWPGCNKFENSKGWYRTFPHIRVAQVYLDFAEAANEVYGPTGAVPGTNLTAVDAINLVRSRANMPNVLAKYTTSKDEFRKRIYNERAVELLFEFHRWFDLRRWKLAKQVLGQGTIYMADIRMIDGEPVYGKKELPGATRVFEDKHYWYPFPTNVMNMMSVFKQNPGW